jgi:cytochrome c peroxidase
VPDNTVNDFIARRSWCALPQFAAAGNCAATAADVERNTAASLAKMKAVRAAAPTDSMPVVDLTRVTQSATAQVVAFLNALTDPCLKDRACFARWIPTPAEAPDEHQLNAVNAAGSPL